MDLDTLRRRYAVSLKGATLNDLTGIAGAVGLATRALRLELSELAKLRTPCILHWSLNHFVVLSRVHAKSITIHDPARGKRRISLEEASREFTGVALEAVPTKTFTRKKEPSLGFGYLLGSLRDLGGTAATVIFLSVCLEIVALLTPIGAQVIVDEVITSSDYDLLLVVAAGLALLLLIQLVVEVARGWTLAVVQTTISLHWSSSLFDQMMRLPLEYFAKRHVGDIISRFGSLTIVQKALTTDVILSLFDGAMSIGMLIMLFLYGGWLAGIAILSTSLNAAFHIAVYRAYRQGTEESIIHDARQQTHFIETVRGIASVKLLGLTNRRRAAWVNHFVDSLNAKFRLVRLDLLFGRANDLLTGGDRLLLLVLGARMVMSGAMSLGMLVAFLAYRDQFATRVQNLIGTGFQLQMLSLQLTRLADIVLAEPEQELGRAPNISATSSTNFLGEALRAENVSFRYGDNEPWVLRNISLDITPGTCVAITGPSGCGKTTFLKILMGLIRPTEGAISVGGINTNTLSSAYRERIAGVLQDDGLFAGSLAENICGFDTHPDPEWMMECADRAAILDDIRQMPMGFETLVGDMGSTLSGGQKQRVILARALYRRPTVLFLDEATSHLDEATEDVVAEALRGLRITRVIVAHRPATIAHADRLIKLESFEPSRLSSVGSRAGETTQPSAARTIRDATRPLALGPLRNSNETRDNPADIAVVDAEAPQAVNTQAQGPGVAEEATRRIFPAYKLRTAALAPRRGREATKQSLRTSKETRDDETAVVDADVARVRNTLAQDRNLAEEGTQRSSGAGKLRTSALALAGAVIVGGVPTQLQSSRDETIAASRIADAPAMPRSSESTYVNIVNSDRQMVDQGAKASFGSAAPAPASAPAPVGITQPVVPAVLGATPVTATVSAPAATVSVPAPQFRNPKTVAAADSTEAPSARGGLIPSAGHAAGTEEAPLDGSPAPGSEPAAVHMTQVGAPSGSALVAATPDNPPPSQPPASEPVATVSTPSDDTPAAAQSAASPAPTVGAEKEWVDGAPAAGAPAAGGMTQPVLGILSAATVGSPVAAAPPTAQDLSPVSTDSRSSGETSMKVPSDGDRAEGSSERGAQPFPFASPAPTATSDAARTPNASLDGARVNAPATGSVSMARQVPSAAGSAKAPFAGSTPLPPARPAQTETSDSTGTAKAPTLRRGPHQPHERSHPLVFRTRTKSENAAMPDKAAQTAAKPSGPPDAPGDPVSPSPVDSLEAPAAPAAAAQQTTVHSGTR
jgi:ATP-binding cassette subfamily B protein RaxB